ncbi:MAG: type II secretion system protein N [Sulfuricaulis sp.]
MSITEVISNPRVRQWLPGVLNGAMLLLLTASLAQWTWLMIKPPLPPLVVAPPAPPTAANAFSLQPLLAAHLFGQVSQELSGRRLDNLPISSLNLVLAGVIASSAGGYALISANGQPQEPFAVGQTITESAVLQAVYPDRVVIRRNGALESLLLEGADNSQPPLEVAMPAVSQTAGVSSGEVVRETGANQYTVARDQLAAQMRTPDFLKQATLVPSSGGGFLVRQIQPGSLYEKLGMRAGDVIKSVNGQPINTAEDAIRLYQQMSSISSVQMEITRGGKNESLYYQFAQN